MLLLGFAILFAILCSSMGKIRKVQLGRSSRHSQKLFAKNAAFIHICHVCAVGFPSNCKNRRMVLGPHWRVCRRKAVPTMTVDEVDSGFISDDGKMS